MKQNPEINNYCRGQALLPVVILMALVVILGTSLFNQSIGGLLVTSYFQEGESTLMATEGAMENGLMRLLRNPAYTGESLQIGNISCTINTSGSAPTIVVANCNSGRTIRKLRAEVDFTSGLMEVSNLREIE
jgi:hypothetical protein